MSAGKACAYPSEASFRCSTRGWVPCLTTNIIRLSRKFLSGTDALSYYEKSQLTVVKSLITLAPDRNFAVANFVDPDSVELTIVRVFFFVATVF